MAKISLYGDVLGELDGKYLQLVVKGEGDQDSIEADTITIVDASYEDTGDSVPKDKWDAITFNEDDIQWEEPDEDEPDLDEEEEEG